MKKEPRAVLFKHIEDDGAIDLGVANKVAAEEGNYRDGGCMLKFTTSEASAGIEERFAIYLYAEDVREITLKIWEAYLKTETRRARQDFEEIFHKIKLLAKGD